MATNEEDNMTLWYLAILMTCIASSFGGAILYYGYVDLLEGNAAWLTAKTEELPQGNVAVRTLWGVLAMLLCPISIAMLWLMIRSKRRFSSQPKPIQWILAVGAPLCFVIVVGSLCILGAMTRGPIVIPFPDRTKSTPDITSIPLRESTQTKFIKNPSFVDGLTTLAGR